jgi:hypothetical protein
MIQKALGGATALSIKTLSTITFSITTLSSITFITVTLNIKS